MSEKVWFITGTSRGFGRDWAIAALERGDKVAGTARNTATLDDLVDKYGDALLPIRLDVTDREADFAAVKRAHDHFGRLDIVVNNAAVRDVTPIDDIDYATWKRITAIILDGAFLTTKASLAALRESGAGAIVNIGGMSGHTGAAGRPHVVAAKLGLVGLTRALAHDLAKDHITVNCVVPGLIDTQRGASSGAKTAHLHEPIVGRRGTPEEVAAVVRFLAGPDARYVTGQDWHVNGGAYLG